MSTLFGSEGLDEMLHNAALNQVLHPYLRQDLQRKKYNIISSPEPKAHGMGELIVLQ